MKVYLVTTTKDDSIVAIYRNEEYAMARVEHENKEARKREDCITFFDIKEHRIEDISEDAKIIESW